MAESKKTKKPGGTPKAKGEPQAVKKGASSPDPGAINTSLAASAAAKMVASGATPPASTGEHAESTRSRNSRKA